MNTKPPLQKTWTTERGGQIIGQEWPFDGQGMDIQTTSPHVSITVCYPREWDGGNGQVRIKGTDTTQRET